MNVPSYEQLEVKTVGQHDQSLYKQLEVKTVGQHDQSLYTNHCLSPFLFHLLNHQLVYLHTCRVSMTFFHMQSCCNCYIIQMWRLHTCTFCKVDCSIRIWNCSASVVFFVFDYIYKLFTWWLHYIERGGLGPRYYFTPPPHTLFFIGGPVPSQDSEWSCVWGLDFASFYGSDIWFWNNSKIKFFERFFFNLLFILSITIKTHKYNYYFLCACIYVYIFFFSFVVQHYWLLVSVLSTVI